MSLPIIICDDSTFAQKAMARALPDEWDVTITFAENGQLAIHEIEQGNGHLMFLDLNMPVLDGYQTLELIREYDLQTMVIVVSGDVQEKARKRVMGMGALDFIEKPIDNTKLMSILSKYGIYNGKSDTAERSKSLATGDSVSDKLDVFREMCNVAMGKAGKNLAELLDTFVELPIPNINIVHSNELAMAVAEIDNNQSVSAVSKGFSSTGIRGEAIILFNDTHVQSLNHLLGYGSATDDITEIESLMDISNIIVGACLSGIASQLNLNITHTTPIILGMHCDLEQLVNTSSGQWEKLLMVEIAYSVPSANVNFELLLVLPESCLTDAYNNLTQQEIA
ncbi:MAG: response regulator [Glaciecola sp.]